jgi:carbon-monoxide dehydrogenase catalytic subunit
MVRGEPMSDDPELEIITVECIRTPPEQITPDKVPAKVEERAMDPSVKEVLSKTMLEGVETVWDRLEKQQPHCKFCESGLSCQRCAMGPCRIMGDTKSRGVCGATADLIVSRNLLDQISTGAAAHSDHGREVAETLLLAARGEAPMYGIADKDKLMAVAKEYGVDTSGPPDKVAEP